MDGKLRGNSKGKGQSDTLKVCFAKGKPGCSDVTGATVEEEPSNTEDDHLSRVEDSGLADLGFLVELHSVR